MKKCLLAILLLPWLTAWAGTPAWITDKLEVQIRSGPGNHYRTIKSLASGARLTVVDGRDVNGYTHITLESGEAGWVSTRYLVSTPVDQRQTEETSKKPAELREENQRLQNEIKALKSSAENAEKSSQALSAETARMNSELIAIKQASANVLQIQNERDQLIQEKVSLESELDTIKREKQSMDANIRQDWFMIGAGVLFGGILLGLLLPRLSWRKKSNWDSF